MKKIFAIFFTVLFVFAAITVATSAAKLAAGDKNIYYCNLLDFNSETNALWAKKNEDGTWESIPLADIYSPHKDADGNVCAPMLSTNKDYKEDFMKHCAWELSDNGEYLTITSTTSSTAPGLIFVFDTAKAGVFPVGRETNSTPATEYVKIRVRNNSACDRFALGNAQNHTGGSGKFMPVTISELSGNRTDKDGKKYDSSGEWQTYTFSMYELNKNTNYNDLVYDPETEEFTDRKNRWGGKLYELAIFPFGYGTNDGTGNYPGASIDIDYIVLGSLDYVTNYQSALEQKENSVQSIELITPPTKTNYVVGDSLVKDGLQLKVTFNDGTEEIIADPSTDIAVFEEANVKYGAETTTFPVKVADITGIEMIGFPKSQVFEVAALADGFIVKDYVVQANYADGEEPKTIDNSKLLYSGDFSQAGKATVTVYYYGKSTTFEVDVIQVTDINVTAGKTYRYGKAPTIDDFNIEYVYSDGSTKAKDDASIELTFNEDELSTKVMKAPGQETVTITATHADYNLSFTKEVEVTVETPIGVEVTKDPKKLEYNPNEQFEPADMRVDLIYDDGNGKTAKVKVNYDFKKNEGDYYFKYSTATPGKKNVSIKCDIPGLKELFDEVKPRVAITVLGEVETSNTTTTGTTTTPGGSDFDIVPIIIIVAAVVVVGGATAVVIVVVKKKKK